MYITKSDSPNMRYEYLARAIFDCNSKYCDPFGYAAQDRFGGFAHEFDSKYFIDSQRALTTVLTVFVYRFPKTEYTETIKNLIDRTWSAKTSTEAIQIIDEAIKIAEKLGL